MGYENFHTTSYFFKSTASLFDSSEFTESFSELTSTRSESSPGPNYEWKAC